MAPHLVVGVDGSPYGDAALRYAVTYAQRCGWGLHLVHVAAAGPPGRYPGDACGAGPDLGALVAQVRAAAPELAVQARVLPGHPAGALIGESAGAAGVVLGARGGHGVPGHRLGAVSAQVALHAHGPVTVVPLRPSPAGPVVVGVDGPRQAGFALWYAMGAAARYGTELVAVHAWRPPTPARPRRSVPDARAFAAAQRARRGYLDRELARWCRVFPEVEVQARLLPGEPAATLLAASTRARLLVIGVRDIRAGRDPGAVPVGLRILDQAPCPVVLAHPGPPAAAPAPAGPDRPGRAGPDCPGLTVRA